MEWKDITLKKFLKIQELLKEPDEYTSLNIADLVYGIDSFSMPVNKLSSYSIDFLNKDIPPVKLKKYYVINGTKYDSSFDLTVVTTAQFIDYNNYCKEKEVSLNKVLSVFFIPDGHSYNDGYNMHKVQEDLLELDMCTINQAAFFFETQLRVFVSLFQHYLTQDIKQMKIPKEQKKMILEKLATMDFQAMVSYRSYLNI